MSSTKTVDGMKIKSTHTQSCKFPDYLKSHITTKEMNQPITNTRITGGSYHIPQEEYREFLDLYYSEIMSKNKKDSLTEKQQEKDCPVLIDLDLHFAYDVTERQYVMDDIECGIDIYLEELNSIYNFDESTHFQVYLFEKPTVNRVEDKNITKDGVHIIIGIQMDHNAQLILRERVMPKIADCWSHLELVNTWDDVFDRGISAGTTNWQLIGSCKPNHTTYELTRIYDISIDITDNELVRKSAALNDFDMKKNIHKLSARYTDHPYFFFKSDFVKQYEEYIAKNGSVGEGSRKRSLNAALLQNAASSSSINIDGLATASYNAMLVSRIKNADDLESALTEFLDSLKSHEYELREAHDYCMILPPSYYDTGSYSKWIRVGWVLRNISDRLFIIWIAFSAKASVFSYSSIPDLYERWMKSNMNDPSGLTIRSIMHWAKQDAFESYKTIHRNSTDYFIDNLLETMAIHKSAGMRVSACGDYDIAKILYQMKKDEYKCVSISKNIWYQFNSHRWQENDAGTNLRNVISEELRDIISAKGKKLMIQIDNLSAEEEEKKKGGMTTRIMHLLEIEGKLRKTNDKKNIMTESRELFYDDKFFQNLDVNPYLLCFNNGVVDFKEKVFRRGYPEDYISLCTQIDYKPIDRTADKEVIEQIQDFMNKLFPNKELNRYMWDHLASTLMGTNVNQTMNMYLGEGQNGKSLFTNLMSQILGDYKGVLSFAYITQARGKIGGLAPEIVKLKGRRYVVMDEITKGEQINEGPMKSLTGGDMIQCRAPYSTSMVEFIPQFKLVVATNVLPVIKVQDHGTWRRIRICDFVSLFTENPTNDDPEKPYQFLLDKSLDQKIPKWRGIFASLLVERCYKTNGVVIDCAPVLASSKEYQERQDCIAEFIRDRITICAEGKIGKSELNNEFIIWYKSTYGMGGPSPKDVHAYMDKRFGKFSRHTAWVGAKINYEREASVNHEDSDDDDDIPEITKL